MPFLNFNIKITSFDFENPLGFNADGTISIPKEVILLALPYAIYASSRQGLVSADSKPISSRRLRG